jgi:hypothetical protein
MIEWGRVPWSLWAYVLMTTVGIILVVVRASGSTPAAPLVFAIVMILAWDFFLLRALRWLWIATVVLFALVLVLDLATRTGTWYGDSAGAVELGLLLLPASRRFFGIGAAAAA